MKKLVFALAMGALAAFGAANDTILMFSSPGPDTYSDGTTVLDGECYAVVWTKDGATFGGLTADCKPISATDKVLFVVSAAKDGRCPNRVFAINAGYVARKLQGGTFALYLLDTRVAKDRLAPVVNGVPQSVNAVGAATSAQSGAGGTGGSNIAGASGAKAVSLAEVGVYTKIESPKIVAMRVEGAKVSLSVAGMSGAAEYFVVPGSAPGKFSSALPVAPDGDTFTFDKPDDSSFFKVIGVRKFK